MIDIPDDLDLARAPDDVKQLLMLHAEREKQRVTPDVIAERRFGVDLWEKQREIIKCIFTKKKTTVRSCHSSGKCVDAEDFITLASGEKVQARDLIGKTFDVVGLDTGAEVTTESKQIVTSAYAEFNANETVYEFTMFSGRVIRRNADHPMYAAPSARTVSASYNASRRICNKAVTYNPYRWMTADTIKGGAVLAGVTRLMDIETPFETKDFVVSQFMLPDFLYMDQVKSIDVLHNRDTVAITVPNGNVYCSEYLEHNTFVSARGALTFLDAYWPSIVVTTAPNNRQVEKLLWGEINTAFKKADPPMPGRCLTTEIKIDSNHYAIGFSTDDPVGFQGFHSNKYLVVIDEAAGIPLEIFEALDKGLTNPGARLLQIGNPEEAHGPFYDSFQNPAYHKIKISAFDTPNFTAYGITQQDIENGDWKNKVGENPDYPAPFLLSPEWVYEKYITWGADSPMYVARVLADFPEEAIDGLIGLASFERAQKREIEPKDDDEIQWGLDVARFGMDSTVLYQRHGPRVINKFEFTKLNTIEVADWCELKIRQNDKSESPVVVVDAVGVGAGVADNLIDRGFNVHEYTGATKSSEPDYLNERAEFYWHLRERFSAGEICGILDEDLKYELTAVKYKFQNGKIRIEEKSELKKRIGRSPDSADALMLCFAPVNAYKATDLGFDSTINPRKIQSPILTRTLGQRMGRRGLIWA